jgi:hypothetical protein
MGLGHSPSIVRDGLVLYLDAANPKSYPGSGTTWFDLMGSNNGTFINGATHNSNNLGGVLLDGVDDYVSLSNPQTLNPGSNSFTVNC